MKKLPGHKTKIVCTIGPASSSPETLEKMILAGMNIARLNFSHGEFEDHAENIRRIRQASGKTGIPVAIMADLPGPKMRIGTFETEPVLLEKGSRFTLTTRSVSGTAETVSITMEELPHAVKPGDTLYLNDGIIQLAVQRVQDKDIICSVIAGGELRSRKGLNIPGIKLASGAFTSRDHECMKFALEHGVEAISQSFVGTAQDIRNVRTAAEKTGFRPFIIAKIERSSIVDEIDAIMDETDGIMVARGDLGVEIPIERIAIAQKFITRKANARGKPVITATQMLSSMTHNRRPTRAEATDVANAILDGTDAVMLSEESAMGDFPVESVEMLAAIAAATEPYMEREHFRNVIEKQSPATVGNAVNLVAASVNNIVDRTDTAAVFCPTDSGATARNITRFRLPCWIFSPSTSKKTCGDLLFSFGVWPVYREDKPVRWNRDVMEYVNRFGLSGDVAIVTEGPSSEHPDMDHRLEILKLDRN
jgi:pyruvate kinase